MDDAFLCLKCRQSGHTVRACPLPWPDISGSCSWAFSIDRIKLLRSLNLDQQREICPPCLDLNILSMFEGDLSWKTPDPVPVSGLRGSQHYRNLGTVGDAVFRKTCSLCVCLFACAPNPQSCEDEIHVLADWSIHRLERLVHIDSDARNCYDKCLIVDIFAPDGDFFIDEHKGDALGLRREPAEALPLSPRVIDPTAADLDLVRDCLSLCQQNHGSNCKPPRGEELQDIVMIDVTTRMLTMYPGPEHDYACLSYVWGSTSSGHYAGDGSIPTLPKTIEDAMELCRLLRLPYLWVDSVCINQEDSHDKTHAIQRMSNIYKGSTITIVGLSGTSMDAGLARIGPSERPVQPQLSCLIGGRQVVGLMPTLSQQMHNNTWGSRAWTLQEALLSPRSVFISDHQLYFECNAMQVCESLDISSSWIHQVSRPLILEPQDSDGKRYGSGTLRNAAPGADKHEGYMMIYGTLISLYSFREMQRDSDALNAFSGILQHLKAVAHPQGFFWGLPVDELHWSLLWCPYGPLSRRPGFPTWSWAGWKGSLFPGWPADIMHPHRFSTHFRAWKSIDGKRQLIHRTRAPGPTSMTAQLFTVDTVFDSIHTLPISKEATLDTAYADGEGVLVIDCALCALKFKVHEPQPDRDWGPFRHVKIELCGISCTLRTVQSTTSLASGKSTLLKNLALVGRERIAGYVFHHFLQIQLREDETWIRSNVFVLLVPVLSPKALKDIQVERIEAALY